MYMYVDLSIGREPAHASISFNNVTINFDLSAPVLLIIPISGDMTDLFKDKQPISLRVYYSLPYSFCFMP